MRAARSESEGAMLEHLLGEVMCDGGGHDLWMSEHSIGAPAAEEFDGVGIDVGAQ